MPAICVHNGCGFCGTGGGAGTGFFLSDGATKTIAYTVAWNKISGSNTGETALTSNTQLATLQNGATGTYPCVGNNARFHVVITNNNLLSVPANTYTDTLTLIVDSFDG